MLQVKIEDLVLDGLKQKLSVGVLSDTHLVGRGARRVANLAVEELNRRDLDLIFLLGDYTSKRRGRMKDLDALGSLKARHGVFAVLGNHDYGVSLPFYRPDPDFIGEVVGRLSKSGICVLRNAASVVGGKGDRLNILGIGDLWAGEADFDKTFSGVDISLPTFLLTHNPDTALFIKGSQKTDLIVCGHTHAGVVRLPLIGAVSCSTRLGRRYDRDFKVFRDRLMYISGGLAGMWRIPRLFNPPEISILTINPS